MQRKIWNIFGYLTGSASNSDRRVTSLRGPSSHVFDNRVERELMGRVHVSLRHRQPRHCGL